MDRMIVTQTCFPREVVDLGEAPTPIGTFRSNWRRRDVQLYDHPHRPDMVVAVATGFSDGSDCVSIEPRSAFAREIGQYGVVYQ